VSARTDLPLQGPTSVWLLAYRAGGASLVTANDDILLELATWLAKGIAEALDKFHVLHIGFSVCRFAACTSTA
jgi:hypothetical protein